MKSNWDEHQKKIIGIDEASSSKCHFPELQEKIEALEVSQSKLQSIFSCISDGILIHNEKGQILLLNQRAKDLFNLNNEELEQFEILTLNAKKGKDKELKKSWQDVLKGKSRVIDWTIKQAHTGKEIIVQVSLNKIIWNNEKSLIAVVRDISENKRYENDLIEARERAERNEEKYRAIVELSPEGIITMSLKGIILTVNKAFLRFGGYNEEDFVGKHFLQIPTIINQDIATYRKFFTNIVKGNTDKAIEFKWKHKSGAIFLGEAHVSIEKKGKNRFVQGIIRNITESKIAQNKLKESEERYNLALQAVNEGIWDWDIAEDKMFFDSRFYTLAGYAVNEFPHAFFEWQRRVHPGDIKRCMLEIEDALLRKAETFDIEFRFLKKDGSWMWIRGRGKTVKRNKAGSALRVIGTHSDITEQKRLQEELEHHLENLDLIVKERTEKIVQLNEELSTNNEELYYLNEQLTIQKVELENLNEQLTIQNVELENLIDEHEKTQEQLIHSEKMASIGVLTSGIAHEINNPINFISSGVVGLEMQIDNLIKAINDFTDCARDINIPKTNSILVEIEEKYSVIKSMHNIPKLLNSIRSGVDRTTTIIKGLRTFSRMDDENKAMANINDIIESALTILHNKYKNRIVINKSFCEKNEIYCYPGKLGQVFLNLLMNSIQAISEEGEIDISTDFDEKLKQFKVIIADSGSGMPPEVLQRVFDPFFTTKPVGQGTGLGLAIVHGIINDHKGEIKVFSKVGVGTEFTLLLPKL